MPEDKEIQRLMGIAREHARAALAKPETQRESYLAFCRLNWKRYAAGITRNAAEGERFAAELDRATRDLIVLMLEDEAEAKRVAALPPWHPLRDDAVEGAMESVTVFEAAIEPEPAMEAPAATEDEPGAAAAPVENGEAELAPLPLPIEHEEAKAAEDEDRQAARFGFGGLERQSPTAPKPQADPELKRKVQDMLRARAAAKYESDN